MSKFKWCKVSTALALAAHALNMGKGKEGLTAEQVTSHNEAANSNKALAIIAATVTTEMKHKGTPISAQAIRSKLSAENQYTPITKANPSKGGTVVSKAELASAIRKLFGIEQDVSTLANANRSDLEAVIKAAKALVLNVDATPQKKVELAENLADAETNLLDDGASPSTVKRVEDHAIASEVNKLAGTVQANASE